MTLTGRREAVILTGWRKAVILTGWREAVTQLACHSSCVSSSFLVLVSTSLVCLRISRNFEYWHSETELPCA